MNGVLQRPVSSPTEHWTNMLEPGNGYKEISKDGDGALVLVVDDDDDTRLMFRTYLEMWGGRVIEARDGVGAVDAVVRFKPDIVVMDLSLPEMDGLATVRLLRDQYPNDGLPVVIISGHAEPKWRSQALDAGGDEFMVKPVSLDELGEVLSRKLGRRERENLGNETSAV